MKIDLRLVNVGRKIVDKDKKNGFIDVPHPGLLMGRVRKLKNEEITYQHIKDAYIKAAKIVSDYGEVYLPIFERMEKELKAAEKKQSAINRAFEIAKENS